MANIPVIENDDLNPNMLGGKNALKEMAISGSTNDKLNKVFAEKIVLQVEQILNSSYFSERNKRFALNRAMANGRMDINKFKDFFNINGKTNYVNINWKAIMIVNTIINRTVQRWMQKRFKAQVTAVDEISINHKQEKYSEAEYYMYNKDALNELQQQSGVQMIPKNQFIPDDKDSLDLWAQSELRVPEEILMELGIDGVFEENGWGYNGVNARKQRWDAACVGLIGKETIADKNGCVKDNYCKPENIFYSYSDYDDFKDSAIKGEVVSYKISEIRDLYPKLTIEEIKEIAKEAKQWQGSDKIAFNNSSTWNINMYLPIDDWNVDAVRFTLRSLDVDKSLIKKGKDGSMFVDKPKERINDLYPGNEYVEKTIWNIYRGVYVKQSKKILEWGLEKNMIKPKEGDSYSQAYHPYSFYMYNNVEMRNLAIPEKIEEPVEQMILARLKIQQMVAGLQKSGHIYDIDGLQEMDLGNGICTPLELRRITDQTGDIYMRSKDAEGNRIENPIRENPNLGGVAQLQVLIQVYNYHLQVMRDEIGSNEQAEGQTAKPRVGQENVATSLEISFNAIDYMNDACISCTDESAGKIICLLHDSIEYGSQQYRQLMNESDVKGRNFKTKIEMLPTEQEVTDFNRSIDLAMQAQPDLILYLNPEKLKRIAKENIKLADQYFRQGTKRAIKGRMDQAQQQSQMNSDNQVQSAQAAEKAKQETMQAELTMKAQIEQSLSADKQKETIITMIGAILSKGLPIPAEWKQVEREIIMNVGLPLFSQNLAMTQQMQQGMQQEQNPEEEGQEQGAQQNPQEESMEQQPMQ